MLKFHPVALLAFACIVHPLRAEPALVITLSGVGDRIHAQNPDLAAARLRIQEALGRVNQSGRLANPELETSFEHNARLREGKISFGFSQRFPVTDKLRLEKNLSLTDFRFSETEVREVERQLIGKAREIVVKLLANRQHRDLLREQSRISGQFAAFLAETAAKGEGSPLDAGQAKLEAASIALAMRQLDAGESALVGELNPLLGMRPGQSLRVTGTLPEPGMAKSSSDPSRRPDFQGAKLGVLAAAQGVALEESRRYEDWEGGVFTGVERTEDAPEGYRNEAIVGVQLKIPLPFWNKNEGAIQEARARQQRKEMEATALARNIRLEADAASAEMEQWTKMIQEINETLFPLADEQTQFAETAYRDGQGEIQSVLRSREERLQLALARLDALREFHLARVRHQTATATP